MKRFLYIKKYLSGNIKYCGFYILLKILKRLIDILPKVLLNILAASFMFFLFQTKTNVKMEITAPSYQISILISSHKQQQQQ